MVSIVGRVAGQDAIETSDGVTISLVDAAQIASEAMPASGCVEIVGTLRDGTSVQPARATAFGDDFDLKNWDELIGLMNGPYKALFSA